VNEVRLPSGRVGGRGANLRTANGAGAQTQSEQHGSDRPHPAGLGIAPRTAAARVRRK